MKTKAIDYPQVIYETDGLLAEAEREALYRLALRAKGGPIVEIGSYKGASTVCLAKGSMAGEGNKVYAIDPHIEGTEFLFGENLNRVGVAGLVTPLVMTSKQAYNAWNGTPIALLFVDGAHDTESVKFDLTYWARLVRNGGVICIHDWLRFKPVTNGIREYVLRPGRVSTLQIVHSCFIVEKGQTVSPLRMRRWPILLSYIANLAPVHPALSPLYETLRRSLSKRS